ncbi:MULTISPECIES: AraC family transcriptional regulator [unclassified Paraburkholderia]|uniref:AraC family transcriptional regulator n=1 Tax=unclassified Paraburkholderia TaxID=2615204 RepID=UPI002AB6FF6C|nr:MULTISPECIES: AraC family transcriptional regulator [unclassified Paraburkholderia]
MNPIDPQRRADWLLRAEPVAGIERIEAFFQGKAFAMHRHDTYAIGRTLAGVQSFKYRRGTTHSLPGRTMVLHPDEPHDGQAGTGEGFRYRMIYVQPAVFQHMLGGRALPFIEGGVTNDPRLWAATEALLQQVSQGLDPFEQSDALAELAHALAAVAGTPPARSKGDFASAQRAREYLDAQCQQAVSLDALEHAVGRDRWSLSRDFRMFYGTSPYRYLTQRRLDAARAMMLRGMPLADVAACAGFTDQAHMTRHFTKTYGIAPARWLRIAGGASERIVTIVQDTRRSGA